MRDRTAFFRYLCCLLWIPSQATDRNTSRRGSGGRIFLSHIFLSESKGVHNGYCVVQLLQDRRLNDWPPPR